jgi:hypothetical protein
MDQFFEEGLTLLKLSNAPSDSCAICQTSWHEDLSEVGVLTPCGHAFHESCLLKWINPEKNNNTKCPMCRARFFVMGFHDPSDPPYDIRTRPTRQQAEEAMRVLATDHDRIRRSVESHWETWLQGRDVDEVDEEPRWGALITAVCHQYENRIRDVKKLRAFGTSPQYPRVVATQGFREIAIRHGFETNLLDYIIELYSGWDWLLMV